MSRQGRSTALSIAPTRLLQLLLVLLLAATPAAGDGAPDPGFELVVDMARGELHAVDARTGERGPVLRVAVGSPAHPTPRGRFRFGRVIFKPSWEPGGYAAAAGARAEGASFNSPMGVAKIPFAQGGAIALHGGGDPDVLGKPVSSGCVRAADADLLRLIAWLHLRGGLAPPREEANGEVVRDVWRTARLHVR